MNAMDVIFAELDAMSELEQMEAVIRILDWARDVGIAVVPLKPAKRPNTKTPKKPRKHKS